MSFKGAGKMAIITSTINANWNAGYVSHSIERQMV